MNDMMQYKGYLGSIHYSDQDQTFYGKVEYIRSLISFEGEDVASLRASFQDAIDDYLALCEIKGIEPEKPFNGSFKVFVDSPLHRRAVLYAQKQGINFNKLVTDALESYLNQKS
jgi:predicted HicB family RNase H-like nuclease